jgi:hypothetical protein
MLAPAFDLKANDLATTNLRGVVAGVSRGNNLAANSFVEPVVAQGVTGLESAGVTNPHFRECRRQ